MSAQPTRESEIETITQEIYAMNDAVVRAAEYQAVRLANLESGFPAVRFSPENWVYRARVDSLRKLQSLVSRGLTGLESMGTLAVTRYIFELTIWIKITNNDQRFGLAYYWRLILNQRQHYDAMRQQYLREIEFLERVNRDEVRRIQMDIFALARMPPNSAMSVAADMVAQTAMAEIDKTAARTFSIFARDARNNGYGYQAHLIRTKDIPLVDELLAQVRGAEQLFRDSVPGELFKFATKRRTWADKASIANMTSDYEYIYSYTSRHLHAEPGSITTNQQALEPHEMLIFFRYVKVCIMDILEICLRR